MKIQPVRPIFGSFEKDPRHDREEKRIRALLNLLYEMDLPSSRMQFLKLRTQREKALGWLKDNLIINNSCHKNYSRAKNLIDLILASRKNRNERV